MPLMALRHKRLPTCPIKDSSGPTYDQPPPTPNYHRPTESVGATASPTALLTPFTKLVINFALVSPKGWLEVDQLCGPRGYLSPSVRRHAMREVLKSGKIVFVVAVLISCSTLLAPAASSQIEVTAPGQQERTGRIATICNDKSKLLPGGRGTLNMGGIGCSGRGDDCSSSPINF